MPDDAAVTAIGFRVRRITTEDAYIAVPVTGAVIMERADGTFGVDVDAIVARAVELSADPQVTWAVEATETAIHPIQQPRPADRTSFVPALGRALDHDAPA